MRLSQNSVLCGSEESDKKTDLATAFCRHVFSLPMLAIALVLVAAVGSALLRRSQDPGIRSLVVADDRALERDPDAEFVLVRTRRELDQVHSELPRRHKPLLVIADSETGPGLMFDFGERFAAPGALAAANDLDLVAQVGEYYGQALACLGFDAVLAPTVDLYKGSPVIGWRALGSRLHTALPVAQTLVRALARGGVVPFLKHYPGHGATCEDSHHSVATVNLGWQEFVAEDLEIFRRLSSLPELGGIMLGHIRAPQDSSLGWPAGAQQLAIISPFWMNLVRRQWGYDGVLVSDALVMEGAATVAGGEGFCSSRFLSLGGDLVLGVDFNSGQARRAVRLFSYYHQDDAERRRSDARLNRLWEKVHANRKRSRLLRREEVIERGKELALRLARGSLLAEGPWKRPILLTGEKRPEVRSVGKAGKYSDPHAAAAAMGLAYKGSFDFASTHPATLLLVFGSISGPALDSAQMEQIAARVHSGEILGVIVCGWPQAIYQLAQAQIPALATWGSARACMQAAAEWLEGDFEPRGKWPYASDTQLGARHE